MGRRSKPIERGYVFYDVVYEDGSRSSNRKIPSGDIDPLDRAASVRALLEQQDHKIAEASGKPRGPIKSVSPSAD